MHLFLYGTLQSLALLQAVAGDGSDLGPKAELRDHVVLKLDGNVVPCLIPRKDGAAPGRLMTSPSEAQLSRLDYFEGAFGYERATAVARTADGREETVWVYFPGEDAAVEEMPWSFDSWQSEHEVPGVYAARELFRHDPLLPPEAVRQNWHMIEARASARHRAVSGPVAPATVRYAPGPADFEVQSLDAPLGRFVRLQASTVSHRSFDGGRQSDLVREVFVGIDAALLLPYDPKTDRVVLIEQARMGVALRGDPNPWTPETVAGIVDAREDPERAAIREAREEANVEITQTLKVAECYPSPGSDTSCFYCYIGLCDLPKTGHSLHGLDAEAEDLRAHVMSFDDAMALTRSGEINAAPLLMMLFWLQAERDGLRKAADG